MGGGFNEDYSYRVLLIRGDLPAAFGFGKPIGGVQSFREGRGVPAMIRENDNKVPWFPIVSAKPRRLYNLYRWLIFVSLQTFQP